MPSSPGLSSLPVMQRFPSRVELRAQYDRNGQLVRAVEEFYDHDATLPCLAYGAYRYRRNVSRDPHTSVCRYAPWAGR